MSTHGSTPLCDSYSRQAKSLTACAKSAYAVQRAEAAKNRFISGTREAEQQQAEAERVVRSASRLLAATRAAAEYMADSVGRSKERLEAAIERRRRPAALVAMERAAEQADSALMNSVRRASELGERVNVLGANAAAMHTSMQRAARELVQGERRAQLMEEAAERLGRVVREREADLEQSRTKLAAERQKLSARRREVEQKQAAVAKSGGQKAQRGVLRPRPSRQAREARSAGRERPTAPCTLARKRARNGGVSDDAEVEPFSLSSSSSSETA